MLLLSEVLRLVKIGTVALLLVGLAALPGVTALALIVAGR
jgi:hypothetical protein